MTRLRPALALGFLIALVAADPAAGQGKAARPPFNTLVKKYFPQWDRDHNGELSADELDRALADPAVKGEAAAVAAVLKKIATPTKTVTTPPTLTVDYLLSAADKPAGGKAKGSDLDAKFAAALARIEKADRRLFAPGGPKVDAIHQGGMGDCFAIAPLGAMVHRDPAAVTKMFEQKPDGSVRVAFAGGAVTVPPLTDGEFASAGGSSENTGCWVRTYEKALGTYRNRKKDDDDRKALAVETIAHGGSSASVIAVLTGHATAGFSCVKYREADETKKKAMLADLRGKLTAAMKDRRLVCAGTPAETKVPGLTPKHAYAVLGYDAGTDVVTVWNPHGNAFTPKGPDGPENGYTKKDGLFKMPLREMAQAYNGFTFETDRPKSEKK